MKSLIDFVNFRIENQQSEMAIGGNSLRKSGRTRRRAYSGTNWGNKVERASSSDEALILDQPRNCQRARYSIKKDKKPLKNVLCLNRKLNSFLM